MAYWFIFCKTDILLIKQDEQNYTIPLSEKCPIKIHPWTHIMSTSPMEDGTEVRTLRIDNPSEGLQIADNCNIKKEQLEQCPLRQSYYKLPANLYDKAGKCQELIYWDANTQFCGVCGSPMKMHTEISKRCTNCGKEVWPQLATAIITLIHKGDEVLLVRGKNYRSKFYGLVAGFVETGETLEQAVHREVMEETGINITNLRYFGSQPWPYPSGIMIGYHADYVSGDIHIQKEELTQGGWFTRENLPTIPEPLSIARMLIDDWLGKDTAQGVSLKDQNKEY